MGDLKDLRCSVVQVLGAEGECAGTGFLLDDGLVVTCAHVVAGRGQGDGSPPPEPTKVRVPHLDGQDRLAEVLAEWWQSPDRGDVAFLRLTDALPEQAQPLRLAERAIGGRRVKAFGFPANAPAAGAYGYAVIGDWVTSDAGQQWVQLTDCTEITKGFSGAPVVDERTGLVVGMVDSIAVPTRWAGDRDRLPDPCRAAAGALPSAACDGGLPLPGPVAFHQRRHCMFLRARSRG